MPPTVSERRRLGVLGSPIEHSKSPSLHRAAYAELGLDWEYVAIEVDGPGLPAFIESRDETWRGLSLTMPLKHDVLPLLDGVDEVAVLAGAANTVLFDSAGRRGFNTDVGGIRPHRDGAARRCGGHRARAPCGSGGGPHRARNAPGPHRRRGADRRARPNRRGRTRRQHRAGWHRTRRGGIRRTRTAGGAP